MAETLKAEFGSVRSIIWPIYRHECKKFVPMLILLFLICFNYSLLRNIKDSLLITAAGAEVLPFIKVWAILPMAILITCIYAKLANRYEQEKVFYIMVTGFLIFYGIFSFVLYPMRDSLHLNTMADYLQNVLPLGCKGLIAMVRYWVYTLYYVMSELWSTSIMTVLCWGFINEITDINEASRFYSVLSIGANFAAIASGYVAVRIPKRLSSILCFSNDSWEQQLFVITLVLIVSGILAMIIFRWMSKNVLSEPIYDNFHKNKKQMRNEKKLSIKDSLKYVLNSNYLLCIAIIVISYNLVINLAEVVWKDQLKNLYSSPIDYSIYVNNLLMIQGIVSTILALTMLTLINYFGWTKIALITPIVMLITCLGFFFFLFFQKDIAIFGAFADFIGVNPVSIAVFFGATQNMLSKATKYSVFDATKEMAYIPLSMECKIKGKAAIDGIGSRFGKSGGSIIYQCLLMFFVSVKASAPYVAVILVIAIIFWVLAVRYLGIQFAALGSGEKPSLVTENSTTSLAT